MNNAYEALVTYDDYNDDMEKSKALQEQVEILQEYVGIYNTVKGLLIDEVEPEDLDKAEPDFSGIEFFEENGIKVYEIDAAYIDCLLETYAANNPDICEEIEKALQKLNKSVIVKEVYRSMLNAIDVKEISGEDILVVRRRFFTEYCNHAITLFSNTGFVEESELHLSAIQYEIDTEHIPNVRGILDSKSSININ